MRNANRNLLSASLDIADNLHASGALTGLITGGDAEAEQLSGPLMEIAKIADFYRHVHMPLMVEKESGQSPRWQNLELMEVMGKGSYGIVYRAFDPHLQREVALKILPLQGEAEQVHALAEPRRLAGLKHPNIVTIFGADIWEGQAGFWMELIIGHTLESLMASHGRMDAKEASRIGIDLCKALAAIHAAGLVHRDIKPANVMREHGGRIILMDLGTGAAIVDLDQTDKTIPAKGTPMFCAPEVLGGGSADITADIYSLGVLLDHLVSGSYPVRGQTIKEITAAIAAGRISPLRDRRSDLDPGFIQVIERATHPQQEQRYQSAGEMERDLVQWGAEVALADQESKGGGRPVSLKKLGFATGVILGLILIGGLVGNLFRSQPQVPIQAEATFFLGSANPPRALIPGSLVQPGDRLFLEFVAPDPLYVYLINEDDNGDAYVLFPLPGMDQTNPLPPGTHRLPPTRDGTPYAWTVSSAGGREHFLIAASSAPIPILENLLEDLPVVTEVAALGLAAIPIASGQASLLRGVGVLMADPGAVDDSAGAAMIEKVRAALEKDSPQSKNGIWVKRIDLANPR